jgi:hypothetical protein
MSSDDNGVRIDDYSRTSDLVTESTKNAATDIRESSSTAKELIRTLVRTGAFEGIARAILETTIAKSSVIANVILVPCSKAITISKSR